MIEEIRQTRFIEMQIYFLSFFIILKIWHFDL